MVIQRLQTLFLLIAVIVMCAFCALPYATGTAENGTTVEIFAKDAPVLLIVNILIAVLLFISIFMFKNLRQQKKVTLLSMILICTSVVTSCVIVYANTPGGALIWTGGVVLLVVALVFALMAYRRMSRDQRILRSYDTLR